MSEFLPMILEKGIETAVTYIVMKAYFDSQYVDYNKRKEIAEKT